MSLLLQARHPATCRPRRRSLQLRPSSPQSLARLASRSALIVPSPRRATIWIISSLVNAVLGDTSGRGATLASRCLISCWVETSFLSTPLAAQDTQASFWMNDNFDQVCFNTTSIRTASSPTASHRQHQWTYLHQQAALLDIDIPFCLDLAETSFYHHHHYCRFCNFYLRTLSASHTDEE
ncbi:hypothetical protein BDZ85DRAFT_257117 [Elsinoe ampelina]|uniref:Uncharacterized protein n=1 Tax=Elsinoe ampelina TaxID=302913 RepID=A0A6A6GMV8_9PEZI|nr:hypothetical protein BDZ85DRAFT_257117 [Elsinoe ampelina]